MKNHPRTAEKRRGKGKNSAAKRPRKGRSAGTGAGVADVTSDEQGSSKDPQAPSEDPYGFVGQQVKVPAMWYEVTVDSDEEEAALTGSFLSDIVEYKPKYNFNKGCTAQAWMIKYEDEEPLPISFDNLCAFLKPSQRPKGWKTGSNEISEMTESSDDENCGGSSKEKQQKQQKITRKKPKKKVTDVERSWEVETAELPQAEQDARRAVEAAAGKWQGKTEKEPPHWKIEPKGWTKEPLSAHSAVGRMHAYAGDEFKLKRKFTAAEAAKWTELDSWKACHPEAARQQAVDETNIYYDQCRRNRVKQKKTNKKGWKGGMTMSRYIGNVTCHN